MATVRRLHEVPIEADGLGSSLSRLARLELGLTEARAVVIQLGIAIAVAVASAIAFVAALVVLVAAIFAPLFGAAWQHLVIAGGGASALALGRGAAVSVRREGDGKGEDVSPAHAARRRAIDPSAPTVAMRGHRPSPPELWTHRRLGPFMP